MLEILVELTFFLSVFSSDSPLSLLFLFSFPFSRRRRINRESRASKVIRKRGTSKFRAWIGSNICTFTWTLHVKLC